jgi:hypothetical protein
MNSTAYVPNVPYVHRIYVVLAKPVRFIHSALTNPTNQTTTTDTMHE